VIIQRGDDFYLRYRPAQKSLIITLVLEAKKMTNAGCYFFGVNSKPGFDKVVERPLVSDGFDQFARRGEIFWLEPDGTKYKIPVQRDDQHGVGTNAHWAIDDGTAAKK
jgi:hypothetical protein